MKHVMNIYKKVCEQKQEAFLDNLEQNGYHWRKNTLMKTEYAEYDKGLKDGIKVGLVQGVKQGAENASAQLKEEFAKKLLRFGLSTHEVCNITGIVIK